MARAFLVAQEQILGFGSGQRRHETLGFLDRHHRGMLDAGNRDAVLRQKTLDVHMSDNTGC